METVVVGVVDGNVHVIGTAVDEVEVVGVGDANNGGVSAERRSGEDGGRRR